MAGRNRNRRSERKKSFSDNRKVKIQDNPPDIQMHQNDNVRGSKLAVFFLTIVAVLICSVTIMTFDRTNAIYNDVTQKKSELATLEAENVRMRSELDAKISLKNVEEYAENVLGMKKIDNSQIEYIKIQNQDIVSLPQPDDNIFIQIKNFFEKCVEYLKG